MEYFMEKFNYSFVKNSGFTKFIFIRLTVMSNPDDITILSFLGLMSRHSLWEIALTFL